MELTLEDLIAIYEAKNKWCTSEMHDGNGNSCAIGHVAKNYWDSIVLKIRKLTDHYIYPKIAKYNATAAQYNKWFNEPDGSVYKLVPGISMVNDDIENKVFPGGTPKERVLNVLRELIQIRDKAATDPAVYEAQLIANQPLVEAQYELV